MLRAGLSRNGSTVEALPWIEEVDMTCNDRQRQAKEIWMESADMQQGQQRLQQLHSFLQIIKQSAARYCWSEFNFDVAQEWQAFLNERRHRHYGTLKSASMETYLP